MYQKVRLRQKCRNENYMSKGVGVSSIPCGYKIWHIKMLPHIQDKCDSTHVVVRRVAFHDTPLKGSRIVCPLWTFISSG